MYFCVNYDVSWIKSSIKAYQLGLAANRGTRKGTKERGSVGGKLIWGREGGQVCSREQSCSIMKFEML